jgi:hypothetical protein
VDSDANAQPSSMYYHHVSGKANPEMQECIQNCLTCHSVCLETINYCLQKGGKHAGAGHIKLLMDCTEICQASADFMLRESEMHGRVCAACAEVCARCEQSCRQFDGDSHMSDCAGICRQCAESCRRMASM